MEALEQSEFTGRFGGAPVTAPDPETLAVIRAWNLMGGAIRWEGLEAAAELTGLDDVERLVCGLQAIAEYHEAQKAENRPGT